MAKTKKKSTSKRQQKKPHPQPQEIPQEIPVIFREQTPVAFGDRVNVAARGSHLTLSFMQTIPILHEDPVGTAAIITAMAEIPPDVATDCAFLIQRIVLQAGYFSPEDYEKLADELGRLQTQYLNKAKELRSEK